ncbi:MAG: prolyl oligopeptidase family serine peptidase [Gammaproteobacteria bacterium]
MRRAPRSAACGTWVSPVSAAYVAAGSVRLMQPRVVGDYVYWVESRPAEQGRCALVRSRLGERSQDLTPPPFSVRSHVHEYGGGAFAVTAGALYFVNDSDQQIYVQKLDGGAAKVLSDAPACRFADLLVDERRERLICVCEDHGTGKHAPSNSLAAISLRDGRLTTLAQGNDFYSSPALSPGGGQLAWLTWNHPQMPWDGCELWLAELDGGGTPVHARHIAGGTDESVFQPQFSPGGVPYFISDRDGFWNIYKYEKGEIHAVTHAAMDHGFAQWLFGMSSYGFMRDGMILAARFNRGCSELVQIGIDGETKLLPTGFTQIEHLHVTGNRCALLASDPSRLPAIFLSASERFTALTEIGNRMPMEYSSTPEFISFATTGGETAYAWYYPPHNADFSIPDREKPPLLVKCHGGPTAMNGNGLEPRIQFWTSRGFAVLDVNYRGSSGFGRAYRRSLRGQWGIKDVQDCLHAARHFVERGLADANRLIVSGSSAGGFTVLCALAFHDTFQAGAVYYGISELATAMTDTHKFEARYGDTLLGQWPAARDLYRARSPLYAAQRINCPVIFFQGLKDRVVTPGQTQRMVDALRANKLPVAYLEFAGEGHGFRQADTLQRALESELAFYARIFGFTPADALPPLCIENLPEPV